MVMASVSLLLTLSLIASSLHTSFSDSSRKELRNKDLLKQENAFKQQLEHKVYPNRIDPSRVVQISWQPRVFLYKDFISDKECDYLISLAHSVKEKSSGNEDVTANGRLTSEISLDVEDDIVARIEERISVWTFLPKENSKPLQVMHYGVEQNGQNLDYFSNKTKLELSEPLMATVVLYLSNATQGGQILFPESQSKSSSWSDCGKSSEILQPVKGNAILFFSLHLNTAPDKNSFHARCPILKGDMWSAIKFFSVRSISGRNVSTISYDDCTDEDDQCPAWAATGECQRNPVYMVGSPDYYGTCRKSCNAC
ncbi:PREDICTED: probable prolyl 4-hydroxylase 12 isoform X1 [Lupinus angustifolius]|uniref:probable prolyl 4-hydroxylase 12 isoform X1 n=1 Tax=Lupinus angustifolius TaxID=3871 RepID=UPI00092EA6FD|nr:PREDICTED: probable prolyl 4-hydroxylase 12 isoform X1 [Lupinus angustifolius]